MRSFKPASWIPSPSRMSMARLTFPSRLELNRPGWVLQGRTFEERHLDDGLVGLPRTDTTVMRPDGVPGDEDFLHFHSSTISGSACLMSSRTLSSALPRQSP